MLTEREICNEWNNLFREGQADEAKIEQAEVLVEKLPATSPIRFRFLQELSDIRKMVAAKNGVKPPAKRKRAGKVS